MKPTIAALTLLAAAHYSTPAAAQNLGTFRWQLQPYGSVLNLTVVQQGSIYLLDGFGKVWSSNGAPGYGSPWFGWDIARDVAVWPGGGYTVIDGFGGLHDFGPAKRPAPTHWQQLDRWRSISVQSGTYLVIRNDGFPMRV